MMCVDRLVFLCSYLWLFQYFRSYEMSFVLCRTSFCPVDQPCSETLVVVFKETSSALLTTAWSWVRSSAEENLRCCCCFIRWFWLIVYVYWICQMWLPFYFKVFSLCKTLHSSFVCCWAFSSGLSDLSLFTLYMYPLNLGSCILLHVSLFSRSQLMFKSFLTICKDMQCGSEAVCLLQRFVLFLFKFKLIFQC